MRYWKIALIAVLVLAVVIGVRFLPIEQTVNSLQVWIKGLGSFAPVAFVLIYILTTLLLIPGSALTALAGGIFGLWKGMLIVVIGANLAALCAFLLARTFLRQRIAGWAETNPKFASLDRAIGRDGFKMVLLSRLSPVFPFTLLNYLLGVTRVKIGSYVLANLIGMLPGTFLYIYIGQTAHAALSGGAGLIFNLVGLAAAIIVVTLVTKMARRAMTQVEAETTAPDKPQTEVL